MSAGYRDEGDAQHAGKDRGPEGVAAGSFICHRQRRPRTVAAVTALVGVLSVGWITDFRYQGWRGNTINWPPTATAWLHACQRTPDGVIRERTAPRVRPAIPCASLRR